MFLESIFRRKRRQVNITALDKASDAMKAGDFPALAEASEEIALLLPKQRYLVEPFILIANSLAKNPDFLLQAAVAFGHAADNSIPGSEMERQAVDGFVKCANALPKGAEHMAVLREAACNSRYESKLRKWVVAELVDCAAKEMPEGADLVNVFWDAYSRADSELGRKALAGVVEHAHAMPAGLKRVKTFWDAAWRAPGDSELKQKAIAGIVEYVDEFPTDIERIKASWYAARNAKKGSILEKQAVAEFAKWVNALPKLTLRVNTFLNAALHDHLGRELERQTAYGFIMNVEALPKISERKDIFKKAVQVAYPGSEIHRLASEELTELKKGLPPSVPTIGAAHSFVRKFDIA